MDGCPDICPPAEKRRGLRCVLGTDYHMHGPDEYLIVDEITKSAQLFALVITRLCGEDAPAL